MRESDAAEIVAMLVAAFPQRSVGNDTASVYMENLSDLPADATRTAAVELIRSSEFFPSIASIRRAVHNRVSGLPTREAAWLLARGAVSEHPIIDTPIVDIVGLPESVVLAMDAIPSRDILRGDAAARAHFMRQYQDLRDADYREASTGSLGAGDDLARLPDGN